MTDTALVPRQRVTARAAALDARLDDGLRVQQSARRATLLRLILIGPDRDHPLALAAAARHTSLPSETSSRWPASTSAAAFGPASPALSLARSPSSPQPTAVATRTNDNRTGSLIGCSSVRSVVRVACVFAGNNGHCVALCRGGQGGWRASPRRSARPRNPRPDAVRSPRRRMWVRVVSLEMRSG